MTLTHFRVLTSIVTFSFIAAHVPAADDNVTFTKITLGPIVDVSCSAVAWGDYDNDGWQDLFGTPANSGAAYLWRNNGNGSFTHITTGAIVSTGGSSFGCAWADFDNDGNLDLFRAVLIIIGFICPDWVHIYIGSTSTIAPTMFC